MAKYPFMEYANEFLEAIKGIWASETWDRVERRYKRINDDIKIHHTNKKLSTTSPANMTVNDVKYHFTYRRGLKHPEGLAYSHDEYAHEVTAWISLFDYIENSAVRSCLKKYPMLKPSRAFVRLPSLKMNEYQKIINNINEDFTDYKRLRSYTLVCLMLGCGFRTKEVRFMDVEHIDTTEWTVDIIHVKGENTYGNVRTVLVPPIFRDLLLKYLEFRELNNPNKSPALFPPMNGNSLYMSGNSIRKISEIVKDETGIDFDYRKCRRTFGQNLIDLGISIEHLSLLYGHATSKTTEQRYA